MLLINNTLPKCGGVWIHSMICRMVHYEAPSEKWRQPGWKSVSPSETDLPTFLEETDWTDSTILFKSHYSSRAIPLLRSQSGVRVIVGVRDPADAALSRYHHLVREGLETDRDDWLATEGVRFAAALRGLHAQWSQIALIIRYEDLLNEPSAQVARMMNHLGLKPLSGAVDFIVADTSRDKMKDRIGEHIRRGNAGTAQEELPPEIFRLLSI